MNIPTTDSVKGAFGAATGTGVESSLGKSPTSQTYIDQIKGNGNRANDLIQHRDSRSNVMFDEAANRGSLPSKREPFCQDAGNKVSGPC